MYVRALLVWLVVLLVGCGSRSAVQPDAGPPDAPVPTFTVGGMVSLQPRGEVCGVAGGTGTIAGASVDSVVVSCHGTAVSLAIDGATACSVRMDGTLWCWGEFVHPHPNEATCGVARDATV